MLKGNPRLLALVLFIALAPTFFFAEPLQQAGRPVVSQAGVLAGGPGNQRSPAIMNGTMVYTSCLSGDCDIWGMDVRTRQAYAVSEGGWDEGQPATDGVRVAWRDGRNTDGEDPDNLLFNFDVYAASLQEKKAAPIVRAGALQNRPSLWGNFAVWGDFRDAEGEIDQTAGNVYAYDFAAGRERVIANARSAQSRPVTNGRFVVWVDYRNEPSADGVNADIYAYDLYKSQEFAITTAPDTQTDPAISGNQIVWADYRKGDGTADIYGYDLTTRKEFVVTRAAGSQVQPDISGNIVVWADYRNEPSAGGTNSDIYGYDLTSKQEFPVFVGPGPQNSPANDGGVVAWEDSSKGRSDLDINGANISGITITVPPPPPPTVPGTGSRIFPETERLTTGIFLEYWTRNGGLAQQGFPISDVMREVSDLNGQPYLVQYFERAVFEYHPENKPPFNVLLSQLGTFRYNAKYGGVAPGQMPNTSPGTVLFPQTGKSLGGPFLAYWQKNGGLAQQGYPISDEFLERSDLNGQTYLVQYFERAVFEYHPEHAGTPYEVLLSQLGTFRHDAKYGSKP